MLKPTNPTLGAHSQHQFPTPIESFTWLCDNIPEWLERLDLLVTQVHKRHEEFEKLSTSTTSSIDRLSRKRTGSTESLRPDDKNDKNPFTTDLYALPTDTTPTTPTSPATKLDINPNNRRLFQEYRETARRKRKSTSIHSNASGPIKFRARMSIVIYYDSEIQNGFEAMVRCLASARNTLRKGRNATSYKARIASLAEEESPFDGNRSKPSTRNPRIPRFPRSSGPYSIDSISLEQFDLIDKELEVSQTLCEIGAHQFLRDASSSDELENVREKLRNCLKIAKEGYDVMKGEEETINQQPERNPMVRKLSQEEAKPESSHSDTKTFQSKAYTDSAMGIDVDPEYDFSKGVEIDDDEEQNPGIEIDLPGPEIDIPAVIQVDNSKLSLDLARYGIGKRNSIEKNNSGLIEVDESTDEEEETFKVDLSKIRRAK